MQLLSITLTASCSGVGILRSPAWPIPAKVLNFVLIVFADLGIRRWAFVDGRRD